jgi:outer membrane cobalamin receptor
MKKIYILSLSLLVKVLIVHAQYITKDTVKIDEVVVTGTKVEVARKNVPLTISVINRNEIDQSSSSNLLPVISEQVPGVFVTERGITGFGVSGGAAGQINIRGLGGNPSAQVLVLIDGHPQFMGLMGHPLPDAYIASDAAKVEIIRGPASILYGSNAFGGVINIITRQQKEDGFTLNSRVMYGTYNTQKYMVSAGYKKNKFTIFASVNHDQTNGHRDTSDFRITNGYLKSGYNLNKHFKMYADISLAKFNAADPGPVGGIAGYHIDILRSESSFSLENNYKRLEGALKLYYNYGEHTISDGWHSNDNMYGLMFYQSLKPLSGTSITAGYDNMQYGGKGSPITTVIRDEEGNIVPGPHGPQFVLSDWNNKWISMGNLAAFSYISQNIAGKLVLNTGLRYEINKTYGSELIPQAGFAFHPSATTNFKGSVSKGYRPPTIRELYLFPPSNDNLRPERMINYDLSWNQEWLNAKVETELTGYIATGDNLIVAVPSSPPPPPIYRNAGNFTNKGIEFSGSYNPLKNLQFKANYAYIHMKTPLPATPEHNLFVSGYYKVNKFSGYISLQQIINLYNSDTSGTISVIQDHYTMLKAKAAYHLNKLLEVYIIGDNLLNYNYQINNGYPMPGITAFAGINFHFGPSEKQIHKNE